MINYMCEASTKANASLSYSMVLTILFKEFKVTITEEEPKKPLRYTDIYNVQTLHKMGYKKIKGHWERRINESKVVEEGEPSRPTTKPTHESPTRSTSLVPE